MTLRSAAIALGMLWLAACTSRETDPPPLARIAEGKPLAVEKQEQADVQAAPAILVAIRPQAWVYAAPNDTSQRLGYVGPGGRIEGISSATVPGPGCSRGWYRTGAGYVCGDAVTLDADHPVAELFSDPPRDDGLPYLYARSRYPTPMRYSRLPDDSEQREHEPDLRKHLRAHRRRVKKGLVSFPDTEPIPSALKSKALPSLEGLARTGVLALGRARRRSGFAILATYAHGGRYFGLTREPSLIPLDRTRLVEPSALAGAEIDPSMPLPVAIVTSKRARRYELTDDELRRASPLGRYTAVSLDEGEREQRGRRYLETREHGWVRADQVVAIPRFRKAPEWAERGDKWIDISILEQSLVAYEGEKPVFATIVSTGEGGLAGEHATKQGTFLIHTKHVTVTMDSDAVGESFDLHDVPHVQYFNGGYALHGAYWHDDFGRPRSHGCVNLSPHDAAWLFAWTSPELPEGWHGALSESGTLVHIHP